MLGYTSHYCLHHNFTAFSSIPMAFQRLIPLHLPAPLIVLPIRKESHSRMFRKSKFNISKKFPCYIQLSVCAIGCQIIGSCSPAFYVYALLPKWTHLIPVLSDAAQCARLQATGWNWSRGHYSQQLLPVYYFLLFGGRRGHGGILLCIYHIITVGQALLWEQTIAIQHDYTSQISCSLQVTLSRGVASSKYIR